MTTARDIIDAHIAWAERLHDEQLDFMRELGLLYLTSIRTNSGLPWPDDVPSTKDTEEEKHG